MPAGRGQHYVEAGYAMGLDFDHDGRAVAPLDGPLAVTLPDRRMLPVLDAVRLRR